MKDYSDKIKAIRKSTGLSQVEMAEKIGISQAAYGKLESGFTKSISLEIAKGIASALSVPFTELFEIKESGSETELLETRITGLNDKINELNNRLKDKDLVIDMFKNEKARLKKDIIYYLETQLALQNQELNEVCKDYNIDGYEKLEIEYRLIGVLHLATSAHFVKLDLINESDLKKLTQKYIDNSVLGKTLAEKFDWIPQSTQELSDPESLD